MSRWIKLWQRAAKFIVSPGFDPEIVDYCIEKEIPVLPGVVTPSEAIQAVKRGLEVVKFFPAEQYGGVATIKALAAPFTMLKFMPTGGVNPQNAASYLAQKNVVCCGGSWMVPEKPLESGDFAAIEQLAREAAEIARNR